MYAKTREKSAKHTRNRPCPRVSMLIEQRSKCNQITFLFWDARMRVCAKLKSALAALVPPVVRIRDTDYARSEQNFLLPSTLAAHVSIFN